MNEEKRYRVVHDGAQKCWRIFDNLSEKFTPYTHKRQVQADAECDDLNKMYTEQEEAAAVGGLTGRFLDPVPAGEVAKHPMAATEGSHLDKRHQCVLDALAGKVVCSACGKAYYGSGPSDARVDAKGWTRIKVTRYIGFDTADLTVDIDCVDCGHGGLYEFKGNPLIDAGIVAPLSDIPF